jgi:DNA-directed RNA polymerase specialized sigma24 family protein
MTAPQDMVSADLVNRLRAMVAGKLRDRAEIDDVVQEVLIKIVRNGDAVSPDRFWGWLKQVIYTTVNDVYRARSARRSSPTTPPSWKRARTSRSPSRATPTSTLSRVACPLS